jgi:hypothetical protein
MYQFEIETTPKVVVVVVVIIGARGTVVVMALCYKPKVAGSR